MPPAAIDRSPTVGTESLRSEASAAFSLQGWLATMVTWPCCGTCRVLLGSRSWNSGWEVLPCLRLVRCVWLPLFLLRWLLWGLLRLRLRLLAGWGVGELGGAGGVGGLVWGVEGDVGWWLAWAGSSGGVGFGGGGPAGVVFEVVAGFAEAVAVVGGGGAVVGVVGGVVDVVDGGGAVFGAAALVAGGDEADPPGVFRTVPRLLLRLNGIGVWDGNSEVLGAV